MEITKTATTRSLLIAFFISLIFLSSKAKSGELNQQSTEVFGDHTVHYMAFNSMFLQPNIAANYGLVRAKNQALVNITVQDKTGKAIPVKLNGHVKNLMQQKKALAFSEIREQDRAYYIAAIRHTDREVMHFVIDITPTNEQMFTLKFTRKLHVEP